MHWFIPRMGLETILKKENWWFSFDHVTSAGTCSPKAKGREGC